VRTLDSVLRPLTRLAIAALLAAAPLSASAAVRQFTTVAITGEDAPGAAIDQRFIQLNAPTINNAGRVAFTATLSGPNVSTLNDRGVWSNTTGPLELIAREGDNAPDMPANVVFRNFNNPAINDAGHISIRGEVTGPGITSLNDLAIWSDTGAGLSRVIQERQAPPGVSGGASFLTFGGPNLTATGRTTLIGTMIGGPVDTTNNVGLWSTRAGDLSLIARQGQHAPGLDAGVIFKTLQDPGINNHGAFSIRPQLSGPGIDSTNDQGIWAERDGGLQLIVRESDAAPGLPDGTRFTTMFPQTMNDSGRIAFRGRTSGPNDGIWSDGRGALAPVALAGDEVPNVGLDFTSFFNPVLNVDGDTAFVARFGSGSGLFSEGGDGLHLVAGTGAPAPGVTDGALFGNFANPTFPANFVLNAEGRIAFLSPLLNTPNSQGLFVEIDGALTLAVQKGDLIEVAPGDFRTVSFLDFEGVSANQGARASAFNDLGQLAFQAEFTDGSEGVFIFNTIPEPATAALALIGLAVARRRRR